MDTVIKKGTIVTASETYRADIGIEEGKISIIVWTGLYSKRY